MRRTSRPRRRRRRRQPRDRSRALNEAGAGADRAFDARGQQPIASRILICDNEAALRTLVRATLERSGYEIHEAADGDEALELAREHRPHVLILDMMMPGRTGLEVLAEVRGDPALAGSRVVFLTARAQQADQDAALSHGADRFVTKPFSPLALEMTVAELLEGA